MAQTIDHDQEIFNAVRDGIRKGVADRLNNSYSSPLNKLIDDAISRQSVEFRALLDDAIKSCIADADFREQIATAVRASLAKTLVQRFGGEMEKQVNALKSDPSTRARITLAIEEIVKSKT